tara:strand:+ start:2885 stop:3451 length:567 start_codon:yes stop_codon:yes gene_type:complete
MGKDTIADYIVESKKNWEKWSFAKELKNVVVDFFSVSIEDIEEYKTREDIHPNVQLKMRSLLQLIGETFRNVSEDVWINAAMRNIPKNKNIIFTDVRHANEMDAILSKQGHLILLGRSKYLNQDPHPSESGLQEAIVWFLENTSEDLVFVENVESVPSEFRKFLCFIRNDSSMSELQKNVDIVLSKLK